VFNLRMLSRLRTNTDLLLVMYSEARGIHISTELLGLRDNHTDCVKKWEGNCLDPRVKSCQKQVRADGQI
jgi:hypothetical protein